MPCSLRKSLHKSMAGYQRTVLITITKIARDKQDCADYENTASQSGMQTQEVYFQLN